MEISCMRDISLVLLLFLSLVCIIKGLFFAPNKSARAILCVDTSPTSLSAVQYPCSSAGSNELYYPRADIIGKQKLKKKKKSAVEDLLADLRFSGCVTISQRVRSGVM